MSKYVIYTVLIFIALLIMNWFKIINIPFLDIPDFTATKQETILKAQDSVKDQE